MKLRSISALFGSRRFIIVALLIVLIALVIGVYALKRPLIIVVDAGAVAVYGQGRAVSEMWMLRFRLLRPVLFIVLDSPYETRTVVSRVAAAARLPIAVVFPRRYEEAALVYKSELNVPVVILNDSSEYYSEENGLIYLSADRETDFHRAALALALYLERLDLSADMEKKLAFYRTDAESYYDDSFAKGLAAGGFDGNVVYAKIDDRVERSVLGVVYGAGTASLAQTISFDIPFVLFSWADPDILPDAAILEFDDSPWAFAELAYFAARSGVSAVVPSKVHQGPAFARLGLRESAQIWESE